MCNLRIKDLKQDRDRMNLMEWIKKNKKSVAEFARAVECDRTYIYAIVTGKKKPSKRLARDIEKETGGEISASALLHEIKKESKKPKTKERP